MEMTNKEIATVNKKKFPVGKVILTVVSILLSVFYAFPFFYMLLMSLHFDTAGILSMNLFANPAHWENFNAVFAEIGMLNLFKNTMILMIGSVGIGIPASICIAYGFARFKCKYNNILFTILLSTMMIPWVVTMIPGYVEYDVLGWIGTPLPLIIPWIGGSAFNIFMIKQFIEGIPKELDEAGMIDGCNSFTILVRILVPQLGPALATLFIFAFQGTWGDYLGPSLYLKDRSLWTFSLGIEGLFPATGSPNYALVMAASVLFSLPLFILLFFCQKAFVRGIVTSGIK